MRLITALLVLAMLLLGSGLAEAAVIIIKYRPTPTDVSGPDSMSVDGRDTQPVRPPQPPTTTVTTTTKDPAPVVPAVLSPSVNPKPRLGTADDDNGTAAGSDRKGSGFGTKKDSLTVAEGADEAAAADDPAEASGEGGCGGTDPDPSMALGLVALAGTLGWRRKRQD